MRNALSFFLASAILSAAVTGQTPAPSTSTQDDDIVRITTALIQVDAVVTDKNDQIVSDLKMDDFELYENGKRQEIKFMEFAGLDSGRRTEGSLAKSSTTSLTGNEVAPNPTAKEVRRVLAFVVDDVTIPPEDLVRARQMLSDFVENKMRDGDLVAIVRTVGGKGLLEQFTSDRQLLRRAIAQLGVRSIPPYLAFGGPEAGRLNSPPTPAADAGLGTTETVGTEFEGATEGANQIPRALLALSTSSQLIDGMRQIPGHKNLVLISGGLPLSDLSARGSIVADITGIFRALEDKAVRSGVAINTMDIRGLSTAGVTAKFSVTPAKSALGGGTFAGGDEDSSFGRSIDTARLGDRSLSELVTLTALAGDTGGISVVNSNNFSTGLDKVLSRSRGYYRLAYRPSEGFDNKFRKVEVKVKRGGGLKVYTAAGYLAREDKSAGPKTKEGEIIAAALSPLAKRDLDVATYLQYKFHPDKNMAELDINTLIDANKLSFKESPDGKRQTSLDIVGFIFDELGHARGGISQTVNADLSPENYRRALANGISYLASTQLPPGYYQIRLVVREAGTGNVGTVSKYLEVPDLSNKRMTAGSLFLYAVNPAEGGKNVVQPLGVAPILTRKQELRYALAIYNAKLEGSKPQVRSQLTITQGGKLLFQEPEQTIEVKEEKAAQVIKIGQLGLSKVLPGRYVLTLVVTDPLADKKYQKVARSAEFIVE